MPKFPVKLWILILLAATMLAACTEEVSKPEEAGRKATNENQAPEKTQPTEEISQYPYTAPLTGLGSNLPQAKRPIMIMVENSPKARPQTGLDKADIVYEVLAEGEITRFLAIYQSQKPEVIGPVRSIRPYFIQIARDFDAVMVHAGGSPDALETLAQNDFSNINEITNSRYFWREKFRQAPHNLYTDLNRIEKAMADKGMRLVSEVPHLPFAKEGTSVDGEPASKIEVTYHPSTSASYQYDSSKGKYLRFTDGKPHVDLQTDQQLAVTNLLVISSPHRVLDGVGRREVNVTGPGDGYMFQQGKAKKIKWKQSGGIIRAYADEAMTRELLLLPGNTWINIVSTVPGLSKLVKFQ